MKTHHRRQSRASRAGQEMVEFAMVATAFLSLVFGLMFLGSAVYCRNTLAGAAREAVRYAIVHSPTSPNPATTSEIQQVAINSATGLNLDKKDISVTWPADLNLPKKNDAEVQITYPYNLQMPFVGKVNLSLTTTSRMLASQ